MSDPHPDPAEDGRCFEGTFWVRASALDAARKERDEAEAAEVKWHERADHYGAMWEEAEARLEAAGLSE